MNLPTVRVMLTAVVAAAATATLSGCLIELGQGPSPWSNLPPDRHPSATASEVLADPCAHGDIGGCMQACKHDDAKSCNFVGVLLEFNNAGKDDPALASGYYRRACSATYYPGCNNLAWLYLGGRGVPKDNAHAMRLFYYAYDASRVACLEGDLAGCVMAGELLEDGRGVPQNEEQALAFFDRACVGGAQKACEHATESRELR